MPGKDFISLLTELGVPAGAIGIAVGLVYGARALEKDASEAALQHVARLLTKGNLTSLGQLSATLVPFVFDRIFGSKPLSYRFIWRCFAASILFWIILLALKHVDLGEMVTSIGKSQPVFDLLVVIWLISDWLSMVKARWVMRIIAQRSAVRFAFLFSALDIISSYVLTFIAIFLFNVCVYGGVQFYKMLWSYLTLDPIFQYYVNANSEGVAVGDVFPLSTLLTSTWAVLVFFSIIVTKLFVPMDYLRRFTTWWFRDVEERPLTVIAKVAATLIILGALAIKAVQWI